MQDIEYRQAPNSESLFPTGTTSGGLAKAGSIELKGCSFMSVVQQGVRSVERLTVSECDLRGDSSILESLTALKSLQALRIVGCAGLELPCEASEISGLETLHLDLATLDSVDVSKHASDADTAGLCESLRFPETLRYCSITSRTILLSLSKRGGLRSVINCN